MAAPELSLKINGHHEEAVTAAAAGRYPGYGVCVPHLVVKAPVAVDAIAFYKRAFGAVEVAKTTYSKRKAEQEQPFVLHAHLQFGGVEIMLCDEAEDCTSMNVKSPSSLNGTSAMFNLITDKLQEAYGQAIEAGAKPLQPLEGGHAKIMDPYGFVWALGTVLSMTGEMEAPIVEEPPVGS